MRILTAIRLLPWWWQRPCNGEWTVRENLTPRGTHTRIAVRSLPPWFFIRPPPPRDFHPTDAAVHHPLSIKLVHRKSSFFIIYVSIPVTVRPLAKRRYWRGDSAKNCTHLRDECSFIVLFATLVATTVEPRKVQKEPKFFSDHISSIDDTPWWYRRAALRWWEWCLKWLEMVRWMTDDRWPTGKAQQGCCCCCCCRLCSNPRWYLYKKGKIKGGAKKVNARAYQYISKAYFLPCYAWRQRRWCRWHALHKLLHRRVVSLSLSPFSFESPSSSTLYDNRVIVCDQTVVVAECCC